MANPYVTLETIEEEVKKALAATLRKEQSQVDLDSSIMNDLGATSIDFLDINFRLENTFGIQLATQLVPVLEGRRTLRSAATPTAAVTPRAYRPVNGSFDGRVTSTHGIQRGSLCFEFAKVDVGHLQAPQ